MPASHHSFFSFLSPTNSVKALKAKTKSKNTKRNIKTCIGNLFEMLEVSLDRISIVLCKREYVSRISSDLIPPVMQPSSRGSDQSINQSINQNELGCAVLSDRSQPRSTGLLHSTLTATQFRRNEVK